MRSEVPLDLEPPSALLICRMQDRWSATLQALREPRHGHVRCPEGGVGEGPDEQVRP